MGEGDFRPSTAPRPLNRFSWSLKYITTSRTRPRMQHFRGLCRRGWSGQIASLTHESFCPFFPFFITTTGRIFRHIPTRNCHYTSFPPKKCLSGVIKMKFEIWPPLPKIWPLPQEKNVKIGTFSWRSMENCNRHNSGTVSRIHLKLGTCIEHPSGITWRDSKVKRSRSQGHVTYSYKIAITQ